MSNFHTCPSGTIMPFAGSAAPSGWLLCDGSSQLRSVYKNLFAAIGTNWGPGDTADSFNLPDFRGLFFRGLDIDNSGYASRDPERDTRVSLQGTTVIGNKVGSYQSQAMGTHDHASSSSSTPKTITHGHGLNYVTTGDHSHTANSSGHGGDTHYHSVTYPYRADYTRANRRDPSNLWERTKIAIKTSTGAGGHGHSVSFGWGSLNINGHGHYDLDNQNVSHPHTNDDATSGAVTVASASTVDIYPSNVYVNFIIKI